jgi:hypothetical protein
MHLSDRNLCLAKSFEIHEIPPRTLAVINSSANPVVATPTKCLYGLFSYNDVIPHSLEYKDTIKRRVVTIENGRKHLDWKEVIGFVGGFLTTMGRVPKV